jgi:CheY-like chemotaxis protein
MPNESDRYVLVIDPDTETHEQIKQVLAPLGVRILIVESVREAGPRLKSDNLPGVLMCTVTLPDFDGIKFIKRFRTTGRFKAIPILIMLDEMDPIKIRDGLKAGADRYMTKVYMGTLPDIVRDLLANGRRLEE